MGNETTQDPGSGGRAAAPSHSAASRPSTVSRPFMESSLKPRTVISVGMGRFLGC